MSPSVAPVRRSGSIARHNARSRAVVTTSSVSQPILSSLPGNTAATASACAAVLEMTEVQATTRTLGLEVATLEIRRAEDIAPACQRTLSPFNNNSNTAFLANFSSELLSVSLNAGDFDADADVITLSIFSGLNGTGTNLGSTTSTGPLATPSLTMLQLSP
jgi:hypothetical protein